MYEVPLGARGQDPYAEALEFAVIAGGARARQHGVRWGEALQFDVGVLPVFIQYSPV